MLTWYMVRKPCWQHRLKSAKMEGSCAAVGPGSIGLAVPAFTYSRPLTGKVGLIGLGSTLKPQNLESMSIQIYILIKRGEPSANLTVPANHSEDHVFHVSGPSALKPQKYSIEKIKHNVNKEQQAILKLL